MAAAEYKLLNLLFASREAVAMYLSERKAVFKYGCSHILDIDRHSQCMAALSRHFLEWISRSSQHLACLREQVSNL